MEPFAYLNHVLQHIGNAKMVEDVEALLPWNTSLNKMQEG
ncbi:transposase domain-containing protein [Thiolapillus sp.]